MSANIKDVEIKQATAKDIKLFYPAGAPRTCYCWIALYRGKAACLAGLIIESGGCMAFSDVKPDIDAPKLTVWRTARALLERIKSVGVPILSAYRPEDIKPKKFAEKLGFSYSRDYDGLEYHQWK